MASAILTSNGRITIPKVVRETLRLNAGDRIEFVLRKDGTALLVPLNVRAADLVGILPRPAKPVSIEQMKRTIRKRGAGL